MERIANRPVAIVEYDSTNWEMIRTSGCLNPGKAGGIYDTGELTALQNSGK